MCTCMCGKIGSTKRFDFDHSHGRFSQKTNSVPSKNEHSNTAAANLASLLISIQNIFYIRSRCE